MRITTIFLLFAAVVFCTQGDEELDDHENTSESQSDSQSQSDSEEEVGKGIKPDCEQYKQQTCPKTSDPVCGTNKKNYASECELCLENWRKNTDVGILKHEEC